MEDKQKTAISLFAGCGGDTLGLEKAGFNVLGFVEFWDKAIKTHKLNFPNSEFIGEKYRGDITKIPDEEFKKFEGKIDVLFAGFPCQGFSHAGKKDPNDPRNKLFWDFVRVAKIIKPKWIIGENVAGLLNRKTDDGITPVADVIVSAFEDIGYKMAKPRLLKAEQYGVPQKRRRVFFIGSRDGLKFDFPLPSKEVSKLREIIEPTNKNGILFEPSKVFGYKEKDVFIYESEEEPQGNPHPYLISKINDGKMSFGRRISPWHIEVADLDSPTKTIHCGYSFQPRLFVAVKNKKGVYIREFTLSELWQIQGFPKEYKFFGSRADIIKQIGNAVPPKLVESIAKKIIETDKSI